MAAIVEMYVAISSRSISLPFVNELRPKELIVTFIAKATYDLLETGDLSL